MKSVLRAAAFVLLGMTVIAAQQRSSGGGAISGRVIDAQLEIPIEYANVILFSSADSSQVTGTITDEDGAFALTQIRPGSYYAQISFIGYDLRYINDIIVNRQSMRSALGQVSIRQSAIAMEEVDVMGAQAPVVFQIDKKVVEVAKQRLTEGGTAVDALENVPSIEVDFEGNVQLRGSGNFTVLIDGRPTILDPSDALAQIPASSIRNIEIITNPSAKYDPDGNSGILNVIMKKSRLEGYSGMVTLRQDTFDNSAADVLFQTKNGKVDVTLGLNYGERSHPGSVETDKEYTVDDTTYFTLSEGSSDRGRGRGGISGSVGFNLTRSDYIALGLRFGGMDMESSSDADYASWFSPSQVITPVQYYRTEGDGERSGRFRHISLDFQHKFPRDGHEISTHFSTGFGEMEEENRDFEFDVTDVISSGRMTTEDGPSQRGRIKIDYTLPLNGTSKFEAGLQSRFGNYDDETEYFEYDPIYDEWEKIPEYCHGVDYSRGIHSLYAIYSSQWRALGYQIGLRGEFTDRNIEVEDGEDYVIDREDFYPSFHMSYQLTETQQVMGSYSRRIDRPRGWYLEPFITWTDVSNVRQGNPGLDPEFTDSYEISYQKYIDRNFISAELFYRFTDNKIEHIETDYEYSDKLVTLRYPENIGRDEALGLELMLDYQVFPWWSLNWSGSAFEYRIESEIGEDSNTRESSNWRTRLNNVFSLNKLTQIQLTGRYSGESVTAQGTTEPNYMTNLAFKRQFMDGRLTATLEYEDIFDTYIRERETTEGGLITTSVFTPDDPMIRFSLSYNINNYKPKRNEQNDSMEAGDF